jgi:MFS family permease
VEKETPSGTGEVPGASGPAPFKELPRVASILVLVAVFFAILMGAMDGLVVATVLPTIALDLHQVNGVTFVAGAYLISSTISIPIFARLSDIASRRNVFLAGLTVFIVGSALAGLSQNLTELIVFRGLQGIGGGGVFPVAIAMIAVLYPPRTRARVTGVLTGAAGLAIVLGPLVGSSIVSVTTWR